MNNKPAPIGTIRRNIQLIGRASAVEAAVAGLDPQDQMGVLLLCIARAFGRVLGKHGITDGPRKKMILRRAVQDFEAKVRRYGWEPREPPAMEAVNFGPDAKGPNRP